MSAGWRITRGVVLVLALIVVLVVASRHLRASWPGFEQAVTITANWISPGPLASPHHDVAELTDCESCHCATTSIANSKCLECHREIADRIATRTGVHGTQFDGSCARCHRDHRDTLIEFDRTQFNHQRATFPLLGKHATIDCERCHRRSAPEDAASNAGLRFDYFGIAHSRCNDCHADPHSGQFGVTPCAQCHRETGFTGSDLLFQHSTLAEFPLTGAHANLACSDCHSSQVFRATPRDCAECHRTQAEALAGRIRLAGGVEQVVASPHAGLVSCEQCHDPLVRHEDSERVAERCATCHTPHYIALALEQRSTFAQKVAAARQQFADPRGDSATRAVDLDALLHFAMHDFVPAEALLRRWCGEPSRPASGK